MDLGFHLAMSYRNLKHPTSRKNFAAVGGQNHALILTQCLMYLLYVLGYPDQRQGEVAVEEGNHLLPPPQGCKFLIIVLRSSCADLTNFFFRESARGSPSADASSTATSPSSPWPSSRRERLRLFS